MLPAGSPIRHGLSTAEELAPVTLSYERPYEDAADREMPRAFQIALIVIALADILFLVAFVTGVFDTHHWFDEDGPVEDLQVAILALAAFFSARWAFRQKREGRIICFFLFAMFLACCVREMEFRGTGAPDWLVWPFYGTGQDIFIAMIFVVFLATQIRRWRELPRLVIAFLQPRTFFYLAAGIILISSMFAEMAEKRFGNPAEDIEEWMELNSYLLFMLGAWFLPYVDLRPGEASAWIGEEQRLL